MPNPEFILLFVDSPEASARWYATLLDRAPVELAPTFAMFVLKDGLMLGLWSRHTAMPSVIAQPGSSEIAFTVADAAAVEATCAAWSGKGVAIVRRQAFWDRWRDEGRTGLAHLG